MSESREPLETDTNAAAAPAIEIVGDATPDQVAALVAVLSAASGGGDAEAGTRHTSPWSAPAHHMRRALTPAPRTAGTWQRSLRA